MCLHGVAMRLQGSECVVRKYLHRTPVVLNMQNPKNSNEAEAFAGDPGFPKLAWGYDAKTVAGSIQALLDMIFREEALYLRHTPARRPYLEGTFKMVHKPRTLSWSCMNCVLRRRICRRSRVVCISDFRGKPTQSLKPETLQPTAHIMNFLFYSGSIIQHTGKELEPTLQHLHQDPPRVPKSTL